MVKSSQKILQSHLGPTSPSTLSIQTPLLPVFISQRKSCPEPRRGKSFVDIPKKSPVVEWEECVGPPGQSDAFQDFERIEIDRKD